MEFARTRIRLARPCTCRKDDHQARRRAHRPGARSFSDLDRLQASAQLVRPANATAAPAVARPAHRHADLRLCPLVPPRASRPHSSHRAPPPRSLPRVWLPIEWCRRVFGVRGVSRNDGEPGQARATCGHKDRKCSLRLAALHLRLSHVPGQVLSQGQERDAPPAPAEADHRDEGRARPDSSARSVCPGVLKKAKRRSRLAPARAYAAVFRASTCHTGASGSVALQSNRTCPIAS